MKLSNWLNLVLAVALLALVIKLAMNGNEEKKDTITSTADVVIDNIMTRTSIRAFTNEPIDDSTIETLLRAGMAAPTAGNKRPWKFMVINNNDIKDSIAAHFEYAKMVNKAPLVIAVLGDTEKSLRGREYNYWVLDTSAATQNILLAAHALSLGAVWCGVYPMPQRVAYLKQLLQLPEYLTPLNVIAIGHPDENPLPKDKWDPDNVMYAN